MDDAERASRDEIIALQTRRPAGRWRTPTTTRPLPKGVDRAGVKPQDFQQLSYLGNFPFTAKTDLRDNTRSTCSVPAKSWFASRLSGTTGKPIVVDKPSRYRHWSTPWPLDPRPGGRTGIIIHKARPMAVHRGLGCITAGAARLHVVPVSAA